MHLRRYWDSFIAVLFPSVCASCEKVLLQQEELLCSYCEFHLPINDHYLFLDNEAMRRIKHKAPVEMAAAFLSFAKSSLVQTMIHKLKYGQGTAIGMYLGRRLGHQLLASPHFHQIDLIIPIPLHKKKQRKRGYNQSEYIARGIAEVLKVQLDTVNFIRPMNTASQTSMGRMDRYDNVENIFACLNMQALVGKHILLVDDVLTTGATIASAARTLDRNGCRVSVAVLAMA
ncbi:ComF family protein [Sphingobacterium griseoflavum]|uniref:Amidophosphoribosyltransferase n=1 Tax=Sphingobacterium griseoflavum TaxID=1474952 RepID=A0ABQ3HVP6_9SPHI|nr:phosphoribosyltransferase family protein [Sphingobacterium griseoflavum]GHE28501.1 amidophosphoribosyltransferase [Sphingobacterium griseoflavum]